MGRASGHARRGSAKKGASAKVCENSEEVCRYRRSGVSGCCPRGEGLERVSIAVERRMMVTMMMRLRVSEGRLDW